jgi:hypothetical protein
VSPDEVCGPRSEGELIATMPRAPAPCAGSRRCMSSLPLSDLEEGLEIDPDGAAGRAYASAELHCDVPASALKIDAPGIRENSSTAASESRHGSGERGPLRRAEPGESAAVVELWACYPLEIASGAEGSRTPLLCANSRLFRRRMVAYGRLPAPIVPLGHNFSAPSPAPSRAPPSGPGIDSWSELYAEAGCGLSIQSLDECRSRAGPTAHREVAGSTQTWRCLLEG